MADFKGSLCVRSNGGLRAAASALAITVALGALPSTTRAQSPAALPPATAPVSPSAPPGQGAVPAEPAAGAPDTGGPASVPAPATGSAGDAAADSGIAEIVVTAQRRTESAQKASLPIAVVSGAAIQAAGVAQPESLNRLVPGLKLTNGTTTSIYIRGVGENSTQQNSQSAVAVSVDGVYIGRTSAVGGNFFDLQRVEVLKGPQGTLYGRNASGGAINIISNSPTKDFGGYVTGEIGNYGLRRVTGALNVPVTDTLAVRGAFFDSKRDGYLSDGLQDEDIRSGRLRLLWTPDPRLTVSLYADQQQLRGVGQGTALYGQGFTGFNETPLAIATRAALGIVSFGKPYARYNNKSVSGQVDYDLGFATLTFQPGYRHQNFSQYNEGGTQNSETNGASHQLTLEARLAHSYDNFKYVVGGYYFDEKVSYFYHINTFQGSLLNTYQSVPKFNTTSKAAFGEATYNVSSRLRAILGGRYTDEKRVFDAYLRWYGVSFGFRHTNVPDPDTGMTLPAPPDLVADPISGKPVYVYTYLDVGSPRFHNFSGKAGFEFDLAPRSLLYGTVATGFKSGGFSLSPAPYNVYQPEKLTAFTLGSKNRFFNNQLQINLEAFYWKYRNQQISHLGFDVNGAAGFVTDNAGSSRLYGVNLDLQYQPTRADTFGLNIEYLNTKLLSYSIIVPQFGPLTPLSATGCKLSSAGRNANTGAPISYQDCSGFRLPFTPRISGTAAYAHVFDLGERGGVTVGTTIQFATRQFLDFDNRAGNIGKGYVSPDFDVTYSTASRMFSISAYVRNANNKIIYNTLNTTSTPATATLRAPRTYGGRATVKF